MRPHAAAERRTAAYCADSWCRSPSGSSSAGRSPRPRRGTSGSASGSPCRSSPRTPSRRPRTPPTRSCSCSSVRPASASAAFGKLVPIAIVVAVLLVIVVLSYRQTIYAYPSGGGAYVVSRENLGEMPSLVAGASLLTDYILTVAVSVAGGVLAIQSAFDFDSQWRVPLCLLMIAVMTVANLRGLEGVGRAVRPADVPLHRHADAADRRRLLPHLRPGPRSDPARARCPRRPRSSPTAPRR